jgi:hypothetical protein
MLNNKPAILVFALMIFSGTAFSQGRGAGPSAVPSGPPAASNPRGPVSLPPTTSSTPALSKTADVPKGAPAPKATDAGHGAANKVATEITDNPALSTKLQPLLPTGTTIDDASNGFKNVGQFVAAVHVSNNLGIPFDQLKAKMVTDNASLGDAIHALKPAETKSEVNAEVKKAEAQAKEDTKKS